MEDEPGTKGEDHASDARRALALDRTPLDRLLDPDRVLLPPLRLLAARRVVRPLRRAEGWQRRADPGRAVRPWRDRRRRLPGQAGSPPPVEARCGVGAHRDYGRWSTTGAAPPTRHQPLVWIR